MKQLEEGIWEVETGEAGEVVCLSFGVHGDETAPVEAGQELARRLRSGEQALSRGRLLLVHSNPRATAEGKRWSEGGMDLNRCFTAETLSGEPRMYEERRVREIVSVLEEVRPNVLVDFHCTVEPGPRFLMHHPPVEDERHRAVRSLLRANILLADPKLYFGSVSFDEWMATRGRVGICYEAGWIGDPGTTPEFVLGEMTNVLAGLGLTGETEVHNADQEELLELFDTVPCKHEGFVWQDGRGHNLQDVAAGTVLGTYPNGEEVRLESAATLIFPKKRPALVQVGKPLAFLARRR